MDTPLLFRAGATALFLSPALSAQTALYAIDGPKANARSGEAVAGTGDVDRDGVGDFLVGEPGYSLVASFVPGRAVLRSGRTGEPIFSLLGLNHGEEFGASVSAGIDFDGDGWLDFFVGAPSFDSGRGRVVLYSGRTGAAIQQWQGVHQGASFGAAVAMIGHYDLGPSADFAISATNETYGGVTGLGRVRVYSGETRGLSMSCSPPVDYANGAYGYSLAGNFDWNGDGRDDLVIGAPLAKQPGTVGFFYGMVEIYTAGAIAFRTLGAQGSWFGAAVAGLGDTDGDGLGEFAAGAPLDDELGPNAGKVAVFSGATPWAPVYELFGSIGSKFGSALALVEDVAGGGAAGLLVGAPEHASLLLGALGRAALYRASTGLFVEQGFGSHLEGRFGAAVGALGDLNGDGFDDWIAGAPSADLPFANGGHARVVLARAQWPTAYCTPKENSLGCVPSISYAGAPSLSVGDNFEVRATNVRSSTAGIFIYGFLPASTPFHGGTLCVGGPIVRGLVQSSGGTPGGVDCTGTYAHAFDIESMESAGFVPGVTVYCQFWSRDPGFPAPDNIGLTNALRFDVLP